VSSGGGSFGTLFSEAGLSGAGQRGHYSLGVSYLGTKGISAASTAYPGNGEADGYRNITLSGRLGYAPARNLDLDLVVRALTAKTGLDNYGGAYGDHPNSYQFYDSVFIRGQVRTLAWKNRWEQKLGLSIVDSMRKNQNDPDPAHPFDSETGFFKSRLLKLDWQNNLFLHKSNTLTLGAAYEQEQGNSEYNSESFWGPYLSIFPRQKETLSGLYIQDQMRVADRFFATVGLRFDHHGRCGDSLTYRLAPAYVIEKTHTKLKATLGTAFKSPSLYQLYAPGTMWGRIGNIGLKPEQARGWDAGFEQQFGEGRFLLGLTYFQNDFKNLINFEMVKGYVNIGRACSKGVEVCLEASPSRSVLCRASYTRTEARDKDQGSYLLRRPKDQAQTCLNLQLTNRASLSFSANYTGPRFDIDYADWPYPRVSLRSYTLLNAAFSFDLSPHVRVFSNLDNVLSAKYEMIYGYGTPGFSVSGGLKIDL
jgi:vitamin B12 transporter